VVSVFKFDKEKALSKTRANPERRDPNSPLRNYNNSINTNADEIEYTGTDA
jgi:hypothetical protein